MRGRSLDRSISILRKSLQTLPSGEQIETWVPIILRRACSVMPVRGEERFTGAQYVALEQSEFRLRWSTEVADISPLDRIVYPALRLEDVEGSPPNLVLEQHIVGRRQWDVLAVHELGRREGLKIIAAHRVDGVGDTLDIAVMDV